MTKTITTTNDNNNNHDRKDNDEMEVKVIKERLLVSIEINPRLSVRLVKYESGHH